MLILPTTLCALNHQGARYLPRSVRLVGGHAVGALHRHGPVCVNSGPQSESRQFNRRMSTSPTKHLFFVYAPDYASPGMLDHRFSIREQHLKGVDGLLEGGIMKFGGAFLAPEITDERGRKKMMGSVVFYEAESIEEVRKVVESDPYYTNGVWDKEKLVILPFMPAMHWPST